MDPSHHIYEEKNLKLQYLDNKFSYVAKIQEES